MFLTCKIYHSRGALSSPCAQTPITQHQQLETNQIPTHVKTWYLNRKIHTCKCLTCSYDKKHKKLDAYIVNSYNNTNAGVAELADAADLKSAGVILVGSSPTLGTN